MNDQNTTIPKTPIVTTRLSLEKPMRSIAKGISWRILATLATIALVYIFTGNISLSLGIGLVEVILKIILYYFHERIWNKIKWGKIINNSSH